LAWVSNPATDFDGDGCYDDSSEDKDDDNDGILDTADLCSRGTLAWISDIANDYDQDGCIDSGEDLDDDGDNIGDLADSCPLGETKWKSTSESDSDSDGCRDETEDLDYYSSGNGTDGEVVCNPFVENCDDVEESSDTITQESTDSTVRRLVLTMLAIAIVPTVIGILLLAYRMKW
jgi:hypothetical protein